MSTISEEMLMAYADGELDEAAADSVRRAVAADPALAERLRSHEQLRQKLQAAFDPVLEEPVPDRLLRAAQAPVDKPPIDLAAHRAARSAPHPAKAASQRMQSWRQWGGLAASLLLGIVIGSLLGPGGGSRDVETTDSGLVAGAALAEALSTRLASTPAADPSIRLQISFVDQSGRYCRTFTTATLAGLACREAQDWSIQSLLSNPAGPQDGMRQASSQLPTELLQIVDRQMRGSALDAQAEQAALSRNWQP